MSWHRLRSAGLVLLVVVLALGAAAGGFHITHQIRVKRAAADQPSPPPTPAALLSATAAAPGPITSTGAPATEPQPGAVRTALSKLVADKALGSRLLGQVVDAQTGSVLYSHLASFPAAPASVAKLMTAAAIMTVRPEAYRLTTRVVAGPSGTVVLVGGGDPTLTGATGTHAGAYPHAARISDLATQIRAAHVAVTRVVVDDSLFTGPPVSPYWAAEDVPSFYAAPITATMADGARRSPSAYVRSTAPDLDAGRELASALGVRHATVVRGAAPAGARTLATVRSAPLSELVAQMLQASDNVIADVLARHVAVAAAKPASFGGAVGAIRQALIGVGVDPGAGMVDGSGLAARDRLSAIDVAAVLRLISGAQRPELHDIVAALPVAGWSGTLAERYLRGSVSAPAAGVVRAKTGTLSTVSTLAGFVHDASGRLLVFALLADRVGLNGVSSTESAEAALDRIAARLAACGCG